MKVKRLQEGGQAPQAGGAEEQIAQMAQQIIEQLGPEAAAMLAQVIMEMLQGAGGGAPQEPTYARKGGKLVLLRK